MIITYPFLTSLDGDVSAGARFADVFRCAARGAKVRVALAHSDVACTLLGDALGFTPTTGKAVLA